jgi:hypothetical protein
MKSVVKLERKIQLWFKKKRFRLYLFIPLAFLLWLLSFAPYINIFISYDISLILIIAIFLFLFNLPLILIFIAIALLFLLCIFNSLLSRVDMAELIANYIYGILFIQVIKYSFKVYDKKKN